MESNLSPEPKLPPELEKEIAEFMTRLASFCEKKSTACPYCLQEVRSMEKLEGCVYLFPCHHRLWNGDLPEAWKKTETEEPE